MTTIRALCLAIAAVGLAAVVTTATGITSSDEASAQSGSYGNRSSRGNYGNSGNYRGGYGNQGSYQGGHGGPGNYRSNNQGSDNQTRRSRSRGARPPPTAYMRRQRPGDRPPQSMLRNLCEGVYCFLFPGPPNMYQPRHGVIRSY